MVDKDDDSFIDALDSDDDDYFEKLEKDLLASDDDDTLLKKEDDDPPKKEPKGPSLQEQVAELEKANKGLLRDVVKERQSKAQIKEDLAKLSTAVGGLLDKKKSQDDDPELKSNLRDLKAGVKFDDEEQPFVDLGEVGGSIEDMKKELQEKQEQLAQMMERDKIDRAVQQRFQQEVNSVVGADPGFADAKTTIDEAKQWLNQKVIDYQNETNTGGLLDSAQAITLLHKIGAVTEFKEQYPDLDMKLVVRAYDSKWDLEDALRSVKPSEQKSDKKDPRFEEVVSKPGSLGKVNTGGSDDKAGNILDRIADMDQDAFDDFDDKDIERIERLLEKSEQ